MDKNLISVIIPTYNRKKALEKTLFSYVNPLVKEIIIVDDGSSDGTESFIIDQQKELDNTKLIYIKNSQNLGAPVCRNIGINNSTGKFILFGEDDVLLTENYLLSLLKYLYDENADIAGGKILHTTSYKNPIIEAYIPNKDESNEIINEQSLEGHFYKETKRPKEVLFLHAISLFKKDVFEKLQYKDIYKVNGYREETDLFVNAWNQGKKIIYVSKAVCYHVFNSSNEKGGQRMSKLKYEYWRLKNNYFFLKRNNSILNSYFKENKSVFFREFIYIIYRLKTILKKIIKGS